LYQIYKWQYRVHFVFGTIFYQSVFFNAVNWKPRYIWWSSYLKDPRMNSKFLLNNKTIWDKWKNDNFWSSSKFLLAWVKLWLIVCYETPQLLFLWWGWLYLSRLDHLLPRAQWCDYFFTARKCPIGSGLWSLNPSESCYEMKERDWLYSVEKM
jgi:hypothetical protein